MNEPKPVADWATDFDPTHPAWINDPAPILKEIRSRCPVAHTDRMLGVYLTTTYQAAREVMLNWKAFSSRRVVVRNDRPQQMVLAPPVSVDPPHHTWIKQVLLPVFTQEATRRLEGHIRETCRSLLAGLEGRKSCDAGQDYAAHVAAITLAHLLGVPKQDSGLLLKWIHEMFDVGVTDPVRLFAAIRESEAYFAELVAARRAKNEDDTITLLVNAQDGDGRALTDGYIQATLRVLMMAGVDTSLCAIASAIWHMSNHPEDRDRLVENPLPHIRRDRGIFARLPAGDRGPRGDDRNRGPGLPDEARQHGAGFLHGRQPRSRRVRRSREGRDRPRRQQQAHGVRLWHPPLHRHSPRPRRDDHRRRGMAEGLPEIPARSRRPVALLGRPDARATASAGPAIVRRRRVAGVNHLRMVVAPGPWSSVSCWKY